MAADRLARRRLTLLIHWPLRAAFNLYINSNGSFAVVPIVSPAREQVFARQPRPPQTVRQEGITEGGCPGRSKEARLENWGETTKRPRFPEVTLNSDHGRRIMIINIMMIDGYWTNL